MAAGADWHVYIDEALAVWGPGLIFPPSTLTCGIPQAVWLDGVAGVSSTLHARTGIQVTFRASL